MMVVLKECHANVDSFPSQQSNHDSLRCLLNLLKALYGTNIKSKINSNTNTNTNTSTRRNLNVVEVWMMWMILCKWMLVWMKMNMKIKEFRHHLNSLVKCQNAQSIQLKGILDEVVVMVIAIRMWKDVWWIILAKWRGLWSCKGWCGNNKE